MYLSDSGQARRQMESNRAGTVGYGERGKSCRACHWSLVTAFLNIRHSISCY